MGGRARLRPNRAARVTRALREAPSLSSWRNLIGPIGERSLKLWSAARQKNRKRISVGFLGQLVSQSGRDHPIERKPAGSLNDESECNRPKQQIVFKTFAFLLAEPVHKKPGVNVY
jgi:hypothetical protein